MYKEGVGIMTRGGVGHGRALNSVDLPIQGPAQV